MAVAITVVVVVVHAVAVAAAVAATTSDLLHPATNYELPAIRLLTLTQLARVTLSSSLFLGSS